MLDITKKSKNFSPVDLYEECAKTGRRKAKNTEWGQKKIDNKRI